MSRPAIHPVETLFASLTDVAPYPAGMLPVPGRIPGVSFFPGGAGLWGAAAGRPWPPMPVGGVLIVGQDFDCESGARWSLANSAEDLSGPTWRNLLRTLGDAGIAPEECFFTNALMGVREGDAPTGPSPGWKDAAFVGRCQRFFAVQLAAVRPRLIVTLGAESRGFVAALAPELAPWRGSPTLTAIDLAGDALIHAASLDAGGPFTATVAALTHPCYAHANVRLRRYARLAGREAETALLLDALAAAGAPGAPGHPPPPSPLADDGLDAGGDNGASSPPPGVRRAR